ncbi:alanine--tRNA ligase-related protein, partial [Corynebacterium sp. UMB6689]|uniref:alanine--tRNA ligase-related protein n=1 Tax=Corynebacterium sp. UMB6689 TaxID=3046341 RepID=UPI00254E1651
GVDAAVLVDLVETSKNAMKESYPDLEANFGQIHQVAVEEEAAFRRTLATGEQIFAAAVDSATNAPHAGKVIIPGSAAFTLHDTYGF